jgi:hypothetical protein
VLPGQPRRRPGPCTHLGGGGLRRLERRCHHDQSLALPVELVTGGGEQRRLARTGRPLGHHQHRWTGQRCDRRRLPRLEWLTVGRERAVGLGRLDGFSAARGQPRDEVGFHLEHVPGGEHTDVLWR